MREVHDRPWGRPKSTGVSPATRPTIGRMPSYEPVDLSAACNAGVEVLGDEPGDVPLGRVDLRGLPFLIGSEPPLPGEDDRAGWGAAEGKSAYASIAALPSATVAVRRGEDELGRVRWGDVERDGRADAGQVSLKLA